MSDEKVLVRDVDATLIPHGEAFTLEKGTQVVITHRLGGNFTVMGPNGMFRIAARDADALEEEIPAEYQAVETKADDASADGPLTEARIREKLKLVFDPEIPVNIVDLGLVYNTEIIEDPTDSYRVHVDMTLTAPGCGMGPMIADDAKQRILEIAGVNQAEVEIVWDPPWNQEMISEEGKMILGLI